MADFEIVDVPEEAQTGFYRPIVEALIKNIGMAVKVSTETRTANAYRQSVRAIMLRQKLNSTFSLNTKEDSVSKTMLMWLTEREESAVD